MSGSGNMDPGVYCCLRPRETARDTVLNDHAESNLGFREAVRPPGPSLSQSSHMALLHQIISAQDSTLNEVLIELHSQVVDGGAK